MDDRDLVRVNGTKQAQGTAAIKFLLLEDEIEHSPMEGVPQPQTALRQAPMREVNVQHIPRPRGHTGTGGYPG